MIPAPGKLTLELALAEQKQKFLSLWTQNSVYVEEIK